MHRTPPLRHRSCSASLFKMEELFSAQYFFSFLVLTYLFWIKSPDKCLNFSSEGIFSVPWIICELFHDIFNFSNNTVNAGNTHNTFFKIQNNLSLFFLVCLFAHWLENVLWKEKPDPPKIVTFIAQAHPPKKSHDLQASLYVPLKPVSTVCVCLFSLQGTLPKTKNIKKSWDFFLLGYKNQIPNHSRAERRKANWKKVKLRTTVWLEVILSPWEEIATKKNFGWLQQKAQPKTLATASSGASRPRRAPNKLQLSTCLTHLLRVHLRVRQLKNQRKCCANNSLCNSEGKF